MDNPILFKLMEETRLQCRFALWSFQQLRTNLNGTDPEKCFFFAHAMTGHAAAVSRMLWPARAASQSRGQRLRTELKVADSSPLRLAGFRALVEAPDETWEDWVAGLEQKNYLDMNIMPQSAIAGSQPDQFQRSLDPDALRFSFRGQECHLPSLTEELRRLEAAIATWLKTHNPW